MIIEEGKFYFIKDNFFEKFKEYNLMQNKENGFKGPCYFCFKNKLQSDIIWFVPISTKYEKYEKIYKYKKEKQRRVFNFVFGEVLGRKSVFLIQNLFPTTSEYILEKYTTRDKDVEIDAKVKKKIIAYAKQVVMMADKGINISFNNIIEMKNILLEKYNKKPFSK